MVINWRKVGLFLALTFGADWLLAGLFAAGGGRWNTPASLAVAVLYMLVPMLGALAVQRLYREPVKEPLGLSFRLNRWFLVGWLLPPAIAVAALGVSLLFPGVEYSPEMAGMFERFRDLLTPEQLEQMRRQVELLPVHPFWLGLVQGLITGATINAAVALGEELGWRGFLQRELAPLGFWRSSALIGLIWGVWHAPLILQGHNYPQHPVAGVLMMTVFCLLFAPLIGYIRLRAGSVLAAAVTHGTLNGTYGLSIMVIKGGNDLTVGVLGLAGFIALALGDLLLFWWDSFARRRRKAAL
ncbi:MAG: CPBP family intramembrane metalloprotease [Bacillota bacterium]|nr:CPBP family intramembrane metalloprotease [Bacillota bacterium]